MYIHTDNPGNPEMPFHNPSRNPERSFDQLLQALKPQLDKLPPEQQLALQPPCEEMLDEVQTYVTSLNLNVPPVPPQRIGIGGEFLNPLELREGRVGLLDDVRVLAFLRQYSDKSLRTVVIYARDDIDLRKHDLADIDLRKHGLADIDLRKLGLAIIWGLVADVPETLVQTKILTVSDFFKICTFQISKVINLSALECYKRAYRQKVDAELTSIQLHVDALDRQIKKLETEKALQTEQVKEKHLKAVRHNNRAETWKALACIAWVLIPAAVALTRWLCG